MRADKYYLWAIRVFKTRNQATIACKEGKVLVDGKPTKASKEMRIGETISLDVRGLMRTFDVIALPKSRVGAKLVADYTTETTDPKLLEEWIAAKSSSRFDF